MTSPPGVRLVYFLFSAHLRVLFCTLWRQLLRCGAQIHVILCVTCQIPKAVHLIPHALSRAHGCSPTHTHALKSTHARTHARTVTRTCSHEHGYLKLLFSYGNNRFHFDKIVSFHYSLRFAIQRHE